MKFIFNPSFMLILLAFVFCSVCCCVGCNEKDAINYDDWSSLKGLRLVDAIEEVGENPGIVTPNFTGGVPDTATSTDKKDAFGESKFYYADFAGIMVDEKHLRAEVRVSDDRIQRVFFIRGATSSESKLDQSGGMAADPVEWPPAVF